MRVRLRPAWTEAELASIYAEPHQHRMYGYGHDLRVRHTIALGQWIVADAGIRQVVDLSCGDAEIAKALRVPAVLGDYAPGYPITGPVERTLLDLDTRRDGRLFICSETVEHLDDPDKVVAAIRDRADRLLLSTPIGENDLGNPEHYWGWDQDGVRDMLTAAGWDPHVRVDVVLPDTYSYQIWGCR